MALLSGPGWAKVGLEGNSFFSCCKVNWSNDEAISIQTVSVTNDATDAGQDTTEYLKNCSRKPPVTQNMCYVITNNNEVDVILPD